jgi:hypothetical protein
MQPFHSIIEPGLPRLYCLSLILLAALAAFRSEAERQ